MCSNPEPGKDYQDYEWGTGQLTCPYCKAADQEGEDLGDHPCYLSATCSECERNFSYDSMREEYYDEKGDVIR